MQGRPVGLEKGGETGRNFCCRFSLKVEEGLLVQWVVGTVGVAVVEDCFRSVGRLANRRIRSYTYQIILPYYT